MNINWLKQNLTLVIFIAVFLLLLGAIVVLERRASARGDTIEGELAGLTQRRDELLGQDPFPSPENVLVLRRDRESLQQLYESLQKSVSNSSVTNPPQASETEFFALVRRTITALDAEAARARVKTPPGFAYGLSRYTATPPCRNPPANPEDCQKLLAVLGKQLVVVERLARLAFQSGVEELTEIRRTEVESGGGGTDTLLAVVSQDPNALFWTLPFEIKFTCRTEALRAFLNNLSKSGWFFAVRSVKVESSETPITTPVTTRAGQLAPAPGTPQMERRLVVTVRVDLVEFPSAQPKPEVSS